MLLRHRFNRPRPCGVILAGLCLLTLLTCTGFLHAQAPTGALKQALAAETRRVELIERLSRTVIAIFPATPEDDKTPPSPQGGGSGVIIDAQGHALTNYHVVRDAAKVNVGLPSGEVRTALVKGRDPTGDIAVIEIEGGSAAFAELGDSDTLRIGEWVLAMGNPFGLATDFKPTVTQGIVSGVHRYLPGTIGGDLIYTDCIQIDAPINPGNSGGPLFSSTGKLVGINGRVSVRPSRGRINSGVGFAVPINQIKEFLPDLVAGKLVHHAVLGVELSEGSEDVSIRKVISGSAADRAGLEPGDIVRRFQGREIHSETELINRIGILPAGKRVRVVVERTKRQYEIEVALGERPISTETASVAPEKTPGTPAPEKPATTPDITADDVARRFAEARGGYDALDEIKDSVSVGRTSRLMLGSVWVGGQIVQYDLGPYQLRHEITYSFRGTSIEQMTVFDGDAGWVHVNNETRDLTDEETASVKAELRSFDDLEKPGGWKGADARYAGTEVFNGRTLAVVVTTDRDGGERRWSFDPETWLLMRYIRKSPLEDGNSEDRISDYRRVGKVMQPFQFDRYVNGTRVQTTRLESVEMNRGIKEQILRDRPPSKIGPRVY